MSEKERSLRCKRGKNSTHWYVEVLPVLFVLTSAAVTLTDVAAADVAGAVAASPARYAEPLKAKLVRQLCVQPIQELIVDQMRDRI